MEIKFKFLSFEISILKAFYKVILEFFKYLRFLDIPELIIFYNISKYLKYFKIILFYFNLIYYLFENYKIVKKNS